MPNHLRTTPAYDAHPPCETCPHAKQCAEEKIACEDFSLFVRGYSFGTDVDKRKPTAEIFIKAMQV